MTDYLEQLMEPEEEDEETTALEWSARARGGGRVRRAVQSERAVQPEETEEAEARDEDALREEEPTAMWRIRRETAPEELLTQRAEGTGSGQTEGLKSGGGETETDEVLREGKVSELLSRERTAVSPGEGAAQLRRGLPAEEECAVGAEWESGARLSRRVQRLRGTALAAREETLTAGRAGTERTALKPGLTVEGLDRAVQRDARRYDGGFDLF